MTSLLLWNWPSNMGLFGKDREELPKMTTRADAFAYMLTVRMDSGDDAMEAARKANEFADIFARNMGLPDKPEPEGVDKYIGMADKVVQYCSDHPRAKRADRARTGRCERGALLQHRKDREWKVQRIGGHPREGGRCAGV